jgi:hypothetical protein
MMRFVLAMAAAAAVLCLDSPPSHAQTYGDAPWCAVIAVTDGNVTWHCYYRSAEECAPHVIAGDRGFCNVNPYGSHTQAVQQVAPATHRKHRTRS